MAEAASHSKCEGTQLADICGWCETNIAVKLCEECPDKLCTICAKSHQKLKYTKDHILVDMESGSNTPSNSSQSKKGKCSRHCDQSYSSMCKDCIQLLCESCNSDHTNHNIQPLGDDSKLYQRVSSKHIQILLDDLHELEEVKSLLEINITSYEEAISMVDQWELDLLKMVKEKAERLRKQLKELKDGKYKTLTDKVNGLLIKLHEIDVSITTLTETRKSRDCKELGDILATSQTLIDKLKLYKTELQPLPPNYGVDDILPHVKDMKGVGNALDKSLTFNEINSGPIPVAEWHFTTQHAGKDVSKYRENDISMTNMNHGHGPTGEANTAVVLPTSEKQSMVVLNPTSKLRFDKEMSFYTQLYIEGKHEGPIFYYYRHDSQSFKGARFWVHPNSTSLAVHGVGYEVEANNVLTPNKWHKIIAVLNMSNVSLYVDGTLVKSTNGKVNFSETQKGHLYIGNRPYENRKVHGKMSFAKFYDFALSEDEVKKLCC